MTFTLGAPLGLFVFIWAQWKGLLKAEPPTAEIIFSPGEVGVVEEPAGSAALRVTLQAARDATRVAPAAYGAKEASVDPAELQARRLAHRSSPTPGQLRRRTNRWCVCMPTSIVAINGAIGKAQQSVFRFAQEGLVNVFYWIDGKFGYELSAGIDKDELARVATAVYEQLESK